VRIAGRNKENEMTIKSNYSYLLDGAVLDTASRERCSFGPARPESVRPPVGVWMIAAQPFRLRGGWGGSGLDEWRDPGVDVAVGQKFRITQQGTPDRVAIWEVE